MVKLTVEEAKRLHKMGVPYGENGISVTGNRLGHYLCENSNNMKKLKEIRK